MFIGQRSVFLYVISYRSAASHQIRVQVGMSKVIVGLFSQGGLHIHVCNQSSYVWVFIFLVLGILY